MLVATIYTLVTEARAGIPTVAIEVVKHTVPLIVQAWGDQSLNADQVIDVVLQALHHPYFARDDSEIQRTMLETVRSWLDSVDSSKRNKVINSLSKESVKNGNNKREESESYGTLGHRCSPGHSHDGAGGHGHNQLATGNRLAGNPVPNCFGEANEDPYGRSHGQGQGMGIASGFGAMQQSIGGRMEERYGRQQDHNEHQDYSSGRTEQRYGQSTQHEPSYGGHADPHSQYGQQTPFGSGGRDDHDSYGRGRHEGSHQRRDDHEDHDYSGRYGRHDEEDHSYGRSEHARYENRGHEESRRSNLEYNSSAYGDNDRNDAPTHRRHEDSEEPRRRSGDEKSRHEGFGGRDDDYSRRETRGEYGQPSYGHHERDHEEQRAETRYGGEDMGFRFGAMNLGSDRRNEDYGEHHQYDRSEDHGYGGRRYRDDEDEHGPHRHGGHRGDDDEGDGRPDYRGGDYGHQEYRHDDGESSSTSWVFAGL